MNVCQVSTVYTHVVTNERIIMGFNNALSSSVVNDVYKNKKWELPFANFIIYMSKYIL